MVRCFELYIIMDGLRAIEADLGGDGAGSNFLRDLDLQLEILRDVGEGNIEDVADRGATNSIIWLYKIIHDDIHRFVGVVGDGDIVVFLRDAGVEVDVDVQPLGRQIHGVG